MNESKLVMTLEFCNGVLTFIDNGHKVLTIDFKKEGLECAKERLYRYLRKVVNGLHKIYFAGGIKYD